MAASATMVFRSSIRSEEKPYIFAKEAEEAIAIRSKPRMLGSIIFTVRWFTLVVIFFKLPVMQSYPLSAPTLLLAVVDKLSSDHKFTALPAGPGRCHLMQAANGCQLQNC